MRHTEEVKNTIISTARRLMVRQGYKKTTIRQIVKETGIASGSIYYLFGGKEKILNEIIDELMDRLTAIIESDFKDEDALFRSAAILAVEMLGIRYNEQVREIYYALFSSPELFETVVERNMTLMDTLFGRVSESKEEKRYIQALLYKGALRSYIAAYYFKKDVNMEELATQILSLTLRCSHAKESEMKEILGKLKSHRTEFGNIVNQLLYE